MLILLIVKKEDKKDFIKQKEKTITKNDNDTLPAIKIKEEQIIKKNNKKTPLLTFFSSANRYKITIKSNRLLSLKNPTYKAIKGKINNYFIKLEVPLELAYDDNISITVFDTKTGKKTKITNLFLQQLPGLGKNEELNIELDLSSPDDIFITSKTIKHILPMPN